MRLRCAELLLLLLELLLLLLLLLLPLLLLLLLLLRLLLLPLLLSAAPRSASTKNLAALLRARFRSLKPTWPVVEYLSKRRMYTKQTSFIHAYI
jgi:hypothetical protein